MSCRFRSTIIIDRSPNRVRGPRPGPHSPHTVFHSSFIPLSISIPSRIVARETLNFFTSCTQFFSAPRGDGVNITGRQRVRGLPWSSSTVDTPTRACRVRFSGQTNSVQGGSTELPVNERSFHRTSQTTVFNSVRETDKRRSSIRNYFQPNNTVGPDSKKPL